MCHWLRTFPHILYVLLLWRYKLILLIILLSKYYITFSCNMLFLHCGSLVPLLPPPLKKCIYLYFLEEWWRRWLCFFSSFSSFASFSCQSSWVTGGAYSFCPLAWRRSVLAQQVNRVWRRFVPAGENASQMNPLTYWKTITLGKFATAVFHMTLNCKKERKKCSKVILNTDTWKSYRQLLLRHAAIL